MRVPELNWEIPAVEGKLASVAIYSYLVRDLLPLLHVQYSHNTVNGSRCTGFSGWLACLASIGMAYG